MSSRPEGCGVCWLVAHLVTRGGDSSTYQHKPIHIVNLILPKAMKHKVHLNENRAKRQQPTKRDQNHRLGIPDFIRDRSRDRVHTTRPATLSTRKVFAKNTTNDGQRDTNQHPDCNQRDHGSKRNGFTRPNGDGRPIDREDDKNDEEGEEKGGQETHPDPVCGLVGVFCVKSRGVVSCNNAGDCVEENARREDGSAAVELLVRDALRWRCKCL